MSKLISGALIFSLLFAFTIGCTKTEEEKEKEASKKSSNDLLILLLILSAARANSANNCSYYGTSGGCYSSAPYSCPASNYCSSSSSCSNLSCDIASSGNKKVENQTNVTCDTSKFECILRNVVAK